MRGVSNMTILTLQTVWAGHQPVMMIIRVYGSVTKQW